jgi:hypothetical protein
MAFPAANLRSAPIAASRKYQAVLIFIGRMYASAQSVSGNATNISLTSALFGAAIPEREVSRPIEIETRRSKMSIGMILLIVLVLALLGVIPTWGHSSNWGYGPSGGIGLVLLIVLILVLLGKI